MERSFWPKHSLLSESFDRKTVLLQLSMIHFELETILYQGRTDFFRKIVQSVQHSEVPCEERSGSNLQKNLRRKALTKKEAAISEK